MPDGRAPQPTFDPTQQNPVVDFGQAGYYTFSVVVTDGFGNTALGSLDVTVGQVLTSITVTSAESSTVPGQTDQLTVTGIDQFGDNMDSSPTVDWSVSGSGSADSGGLVHAAQRFRYRCTRSPLQAANSRPAQLFLF